MNVKEAIMTRRTVREFKPDLVPDELLVDILETAKWSPSPVNSQPWRFIIIKDKETLSRLMEHAKYGGHLVKAPMAIAVVVTHIEGYHWYNEIEEYKYAGAVFIANLMLAAWGKGVGTGWVSIERDKVNSILGVPKDHSVAAVIPMGYPMEIESHNSADRKPLESMVFSEKFGERFPRIDAKKVEEKWKK